jgi:Immunoglobulin domain
MKLKYILSCLAAVLLSATAASAQTTLADWTFETSLPATAGPFSPEVGSGSASGHHAGAATYSHPAGNASASSFSANTWATGDYYQFSVSTLGFQSIVVSFDQSISGTGPRDFNFQYSTDGTTFTTFGSSYIALTNGATANNEGTGKTTSTWGTSGTRQSAYTDTNDLTAISAINNQSTVYFRIVMADNLNGNGVTLSGTAGACRVDNFTVTGTSLSSTPSIVNQPLSLNVFKGDTASFSVTAGGDAPLSYQWYYTNSTGLPFVPLADGPSSYGFGSITNSTNANLRLFFVDPAQAGGYEVVVTNLSGSATSQVAILTVNLRTPIVTNIAYLRSLLDPVNWKPIDTTNLYTFTGTVTSPYNLSTSASVEEFYVQDSTGCGISVDFVNDTATPSLGDIVQVTSPLAQFDGLLQAAGDLHNPTHSISTVSSGNPLPAPKVFDIGSVTNTPFMETNIEGSLIVVSNVFFAQNLSQFPFGADVNMTNVNGKVLQLFVNANSDLGTQPIPVFATSVTGAVGQFTTSTPATGGYELDVFHIADVMSGTTANIPFTIQTAGTNAILTWNGTLFSLQSSTNVAGPYATISGATSPYTNAYTTNSLNFYRLVH